jgi:transcriptional regulator with XRE-family HTH domain
MKYQELINSNIRALRQKQGLTQEIFSEKIGISLQGLSNIERNKYQPTAETIDKICKTFNITPQELLIINSNAGEDIINNIITLLNQCSPRKLKKIYKIVSILVK